MGLARKKADIKDESTDLRSLCWTKDPDRAAVRSAQSEVDRRLHVLYEGPSFNAAAFFDPEEHEVRIRTKAEADLKTAEAVLEREKALLAYDAGSDAAVKQAEKNLADVRLALRKREESALSCAISPLGCARKRRRPQKPRAGGAV
jgi:hypothetical protein